MKQIKSTSNKVIIEQPLDSMHLCELLDYAIDVKDNDLIIAVLTISMICGDRKKVTELRPYSAKNDYRPRWHK
jgi:hypothetical protein